MDFLAQNWGTLAIGLLIAAIVVLIIIKFIRDRKKGVSSCGCSCENCPGACHSHKNNHT